MKPSATAVLAAVAVIAIAPTPVIALLLAVIGAGLVVAAIVRACGGRARKGWQAPVAMCAPQAATRPAAPRDRVRGSSC